MMATSRKLRYRYDTRKDQSIMDLVEQPNPYKRQYTAIEKPGRREKSGTEKSQRVVTLRLKKAVPQKLRHMDREYQKRQKRQSPSGDAGTDENNEAEEQQGEDGETEANKQEGHVQDQILQFHQGVDELSKVLVAGLQKDNDSLKIQVELKNSEYVTQVAVLKNQIETLTNQVEKKTTECGEVEQTAAKLKSEVEQWKSGFVDCAVKLGREVEAHRKENEALRAEKDSFKEENDSLKLWKSEFVDCVVKLRREIEAHKKENEALRTEKDSLKEENDSLKRQVEKSNTQCAKAGQIVAQLKNKVELSVELFEGEFMKGVELKNQNKSLKDQLAKWKTDCGKAKLARKELESQLTAFWTKLGIATPPSTSSGFATPPTTKRKTIRSPKNEDAGN